MKRIAVISDTHIPKAAADLPESVYKTLRSADMIFHAGDLVELSLYEKLQKIAPTYAVYGNMDMPDVRAHFPEKDIIKVDGFKIGMMHGDGPPAKVMEFVADKFTNVDAIVFGHSHVPFSEKIKNTLFFNPGSPTDKIFAPYNSFGMLEIGKEIRGNIIRL